MRRITFIKRWHGGRNYSELTIQSPQDSCISDHAHRQITLFDGDNLLSSDARQGREAGLGQPAIQAALAELFIPSIFPALRSLQQLSQLFATACPFVRLGVGHITQHLLDSSLACLASLRVVGVIPCLNQPRLIPFPGV